MKTRIKKINCWDYKQCGHGPNGNNRTGTLCPAASNKTYRGKNSGINGGRYCWKIPGTLCDGRINYSLPAKLSCCINCDFFKIVNKEEGIDFEL